MFATSDCALTAFTILDSQRIAGPLIPWNMRLSQIVTELRKFGTSKTKVGLSLVTN
jgi:hypothetical protein